MSGRQARTASARTAARRAGALLACSLAAGGVALAPRAAGAAEPAPAVLAATPYMGWDTSYAVSQPLTETEVLQQASRVKELGLESRGYRLIWLDAGWWQGQRDTEGRIVASADQWPHGLAWVARVLHANGFQLGLYTDAGSTGCGGGGGSYGHYQLDIDTFAAWGIDAVKVDWCGGSLQALDPATQYTQVHEAIAGNASGRPMLLEVCNFLQPGQRSPGLPSFAQSAFASYTFGPETANSWRTDTDIGVRGSVRFSSVLRNLDADATQPAAAGPGHWNDPGYLSPGQGMNAAQFRTQVSMWAMLAAPLVISANMERIGGTSLAAVANRTVIAIDQDPAGLQGWLVPGSVAGNGEAFERPLADGSIAVALLNRGSTAQVIATSTAAIGLPAVASYAVLDAWSGRHSSTTGAISAKVAPYATILLRVTPS